MELHNVAPVVVEAVGIAVAVKDWTVEIVEAARAADIVYLLIADLLA